MNISISYCTAVIVIFSSNPDCDHETMAVYHDEVEIEDFEYDEVRK